MNHSYFMAIPKEHLRRFHGMDDAKEIWEAIRTRFGAHGAEVSTEDANYKFLRSLPPAWSNLAITMRTKPDVDTLSIDDLYNNLRFYTPSTSSNNIPEREVPASFADEVIYSLFVKQSEDLDLLHEDLEQIDDLDIEEMDINWQIAMIAIRMKKFYKKTRRRVRIDGNKHGQMMERRETRFIKIKELERKSRIRTVCCLWMMVVGTSGPEKNILVEEVDTNHALMAISSNNEDHPLKNMEDKEGKEDGGKLSSKGGHCGSKLDSEDEDAENSSKQGRNLQEEGLDEMVRSIMKEKSEEYETPTQGKTSREAYISLEGLEAAETLAKVLTQRTKTYTRKFKTGLRRKLDADEVSTGEGINTGFTDVNTAFEEINSGDESIIPSPKKGQREGKAVLEEKSQSNTDELELSETQKNRMAQVQEATKYYTEEDWDSVRAKLEANRDLSSKVLSIDFSSDDFAKKMVELINEKKMLKGLQKNKSESARFDTEEDVEAYMDERVDEPSSEEFQIGLLNDLTRDDLKELYRLMMLKYGDSRPEEEYERAAHIYMLTEVKCPLPSRVCQAMLEKKLIGDRKDEVCYQLLKLIERQAQQQ
ncbi:hypothetical protein Tco_0491367 [Tanacetum coccineum]